MPKNRQLFLKVATTSQQVGQIVDRQLTPIGVPAFLLALLTHIRDLQPVSPSEISIASGAPMTTLRDNVRRLEKRGLVRRAPNPADGRSYLLKLTARGEAVTRAADPALLDAYLELEARLQRPLEEYERYLDELSQALAGMLADAGGYARPELGLAQPRR
jgi:DNA-binding MarR family transcriptional regulator